MLETVDVPILLDVMDWLALAVTVPFVEMLDAEETPDRLDDSDAAGDLEVLALEVAALLETSEVLALDDSAP